MLVGDCSAPHCDPNQLNWTVLNFVALLIHIPGACDCCDDDDDDDDDDGDDDERDQEGEQDVLRESCVCLIVPAGRNVLHECVISHSLSLFAF